MAAAEVPRDAVPGVTQAPTTIDIREATDVDLPAVTALLNDEIAASPYVYAEVPITVEDRRAWLSAHEAAGLPVLVAADDPRLRRSKDSARDVIAWASLSPYRASSGYRFTAEVSVYVAAAAQRRGIATRLVTALVERAHRLGLHALVASIDSENVPSVALFERFGFVERARLPDVGRKFDAWRTQLLLVRIIGE